MNQEITMYPLRLSFGFPRALALLAAAIACPAWAHHPLGGAVPATFWQGLLSGLGHPVIEWDHLLFLLAAAAAVALARVAPKRALAMLFAYAAAGAVGTAWRVTGWEIVLANGAVTATLLLVALCLFVQRLPGALAAGLGAAACGFFHGYAYGEAVIGAETTPLLAYLGGLVLIQTLLLVGSYGLLRQLASLVPQTRITVGRVLGILVGATTFWMSWS